MNIPSIFQLPSSYVLWFIIFDDFEEKDHWLSLSVTKVFVEQPRLHRFVKYFILVTGEIFLTFWHLTFWHPIFWHRHFDNKKFFHPDIVPLHANQDILTFCNWDILPLKAFWPPDILQPKFYPTPQSILTLVTWIQRMQAWPLAKPHVGQTES